MKKHAPHSSLNHEKHPEKEENFLEKKKTLHHSSHTKLKKKKKHPSKDSLSVAKKKKHKKTAEERLEEQYIEEGLHAIYGENKVDFSTMERSKSWITSMLFSLVTTLAVIAIVAWGAFFAYTTYFNQQTGDDFEVEIEAPLEAKSGEVVDIVVHYKNPSNIPLARLSLEVRVPESFDIQEIQPIPSDQEDYIWEIGALSPFSDGEIHLTGIWNAAIPSSLPVQVFTNYRPSNFNADFQDIETIQITTFGSLLETTVEGPEEGIAGEILPYTVTIQNLSEELMQNIQVDLIAPNGFFFETRNPELPPEKPTTWMIEALDPGDTYNIEFTGSFASDITGFQYFDVETSLKQGEKFLVQNTQELFSDITSTGASLQMIANGVTDTVRTDSDDPLRLSISLENTGESDLDLTSLHLSFEAEESLPLNFGEASLEGGQKNGNEIVWSPPRIDPLPPGERHTINVVIPHITEGVSDYADAYTITSTSLVNDLEVKSSPVTVQINSDTSFHAEARYYKEEGAPVGNGALPPTVGKETTYRVYWSIENSLHDLKNIEVRASLPPGAFFEGGETADLGNIEYLHADNEVIWEISLLPKDIPFIEGSFSITVEPSESQEGKFIKILSGSSFVATDTVTESTLQEATYTLDSEIPNDEKAEGKNVVVAE